MPILSRYVPVDLGGRRAVVVGGSIAGLATALALGERGAEVIVVDSDPPPPDSPELAFASWDRKRVPQLRHSHAFLARVRNVLRRSQPEIYRRLLEEGAMELRLLDYPPRAVRPLAPEPGDEDLAALGCRRSTFEWVVRKAVSERDSSSFLSGATATALEVRPGAVPRVTGIRLDDGRTIAADLVVDASGRNTRSPVWLEGAGAPPPDEERSPSSILYYTRFYRLRPSADFLPPTDEPAMADFGWIKFAVFPADARTFSITFAIPVALRPLKVLAESAAFDALSAWFPGLAPWLDPEVSEPLGDLPRGVLAMGGLENCRRRFLRRDGLPLAEGFFAIGDSAYHTNPLYGRGCTQAFLHANLLGEALDATVGDPVRAAAFLDDLATAEIEPFYHASVLADRGAARKAKSLSNGNGRAPRGTPFERLRDSFFENGVVPAMRAHPAVYRAFVRMLNMMETPDEAFFRPDVALPCLEVWLGGRSTRERLAPVPPDYAEGLAICEAALVRG